MIRNKKLIITILTTLFILMISVGVAFAALQSTMTVSMGKVVQKALTLDVRISPIGSIEGASSGPGNFECGSVTATTTGISGINAHFTGPSQVCKYKFTLSNKGTLDAKITKISLDGPTGVTCTQKNSVFTCGNIKYSVINTSGTDYTIGETLGSGSGLFCYLVVQTTSSLVEDAFTHDVSLDFTFEEII